MSYVRFVVLTTARTGSSMVRDLLWSHHNILSLEELFHEQDEERERQATRSAENVQGKIGGDVRNYFLQQEESGVTFLQERVYTSYPEQVEAVGFKLFYEHPYASPAWQGVLDYFEQTPTYIVHLKRKNLLDRYLSLQLGIRSAQWVLTDGMQRPDNSEPIVLDVDDCIKNFHKIEWFYRDVENRFRHHAVLDVAYEDIVENMTYETQRILQFLHASPQSLTTVTKKQRQQTKVELIRNYNELKDEFRNYIKKGWANEQWLDFFDEG